MNTTTSVSEQEATPVPAPAETSKAATPAAAPVAAKAAKPVIQKAAPVKAAAKQPAKAAKPAAKAQTKAQAKVVAAEEPAAPVKPAKESKAKKPAPKKPKLVRDSFTFPESDYALIAELKQRALKAGHEIKKSELLRAGLATLAAMAEPDLLKALAEVERIKTGRPTK